MSIHRGKWSLEDRYIQYPNEWARDERISRRARGLLVELASHRPGWSVTVETLMEKGTEGRDAIRAAILELETYGYLTRSQKQSNGGKFAGVDYDLADPELLRLSRVGLTDVGSADVGESVAKKTKSLEDKLFEEDYGSAKAERTPKPRPSAVPAEFSVDDLMVAWAHKNTPLVKDLQTETGKFKDWHRAHGSKMVDWGAAWRNWMRKANGYAAEKLGPADNVGTTQSDSKRIADDFYRAEGYIK